MLGCLLLAEAALGAGFGTDRRTLLPDAPPYRSVVRITAHGGVGSGLLVGPDLVLTVAHAVSDKGKLYEDVEVQLGGPDGGDRARVTSAVLKSDPDLSPDSGHDWAILRLDRPFGWRYGWVEAADWKKERLLNQTVEFVGYGSCPDERSPEFGRLPFRSPGTVRDLGEHIVFHDCAMWGGSSGGALLARDGRKFFVVAVNSAGVDVEGEKLEHGFRRNYQKELANIAVPSSEWLEALKGMARPSEPVWRRLEIRNRGNEPLRVRLRVPSVFADPADPFLVKPWKTIEPGRSLQVVEARDGVVEPEVWICAQNARGDRVGPEPGLRLESSEENLDFFAYKLGPQSLASLSLP